MVRAIQQHIISTLNQGKHMDVHITAKDYLELEKAANNLASNKIVRLYQLENGFRVMARNRGLKRWSI